MHVEFHCRPNLELIISAREKSYALCFILLHSVSQCVYVIIMKQVYIQSCAVINKQQRTAFNS